MSDWAGIKKAINSDLSRPLNHLIWLNDYKTYGQNSYVFQNKDILHELYSNYELCMNDLDIIDEVVEYANTIGEVGKAFSNVHGVTASTSLEGVATIEELFNSAESLSAIANGEGAVSYITSNQRYLDNDTYMTAITTNADIIKAYAKSKADWKFKKPFILKINNAKAYITNVYNILTNADHFTAKISNKNQKGTNSNKTELNTLRQYGTEEYAYNGMIACRIGQNSSYSTSEGWGAYVEINGEKIKEVLGASSGTSVTASTVNAIVIPTATFWESYYGQVALSVYIAN